ncbi:hypothetical protein BT96DRAFT_837690, partial [Gymnopus androsaceus JB14]
EREVLKEEGAELAPVCETHAKAAQNVKRSFTNLVRAPRSKEKKPVRGILAF